MKNKLRFLGIIALVAVMGFSMIGCDNTDDSSIEGTWTYSENYQGVTYTITVVFNGNGTGTATEAGGGESYSSSFTWRQSGTTVYVTDKDGDESSFTFNGGKTFTIEGMTYTRK